MSIPTPSAIGQRLTQQKQHAMREAEQMKSMPQKPESSVKAGSKASHSSRQVKGSGTSSKSEPMRHSTRKKSSTTRSASSTSTKSSSEKKPDETKGNASSEASPSVVKKPFVRKEHLTQRLSSNEKLRELRDALTPRHPNRGQEKKSSARKGGTPNPKTTSSTSNAK